MSPSVRAGGEPVAWGWARTALGRLLCAAGERGALWIALREEGARGRLERFLGRWAPGARLVRDGDVLAPLIEQLEGYGAGELRRFRLRTDLRGTAFQRAVWREVARIPFGRTRTYGEIAARLGRPGAARAVGAANGANPLPLVVP